MSEIIPRQYGTWMGPGDVPIVNATLDQELPVQLLGVCTGEDAESGELDVSLYQHRPHLVLARGTPNHDVGASIQIGIVKSTSGEGENRTYGVQAYSIASGGSFASGQTYSPVYSFGVVYEIDDVVSVCYDGSELNGVVGTAYIVNDLVDPMPIYVKVTKVNAVGTDYDVRPANTDGTIASGSDTISGVTCTEEIVEYADHLWQLETSFQYVSDMLTIADENFITLELKVPGFASLNVNTNPWKKNSTSADDFLPFVDDYVWIAKNPYGGSAPYYIISSQPVPIGDFT